MIVLIVLVVGLVAAVVIANGVDTVVAGRLRQIAVLRLLGADARSLRRAIVRGATSVAMVGAAAGMPIFEPAWPTVVIPVRIGNSPVMKFARPAVQLASA